MLVTWEKVILPSSFTAGPQYMSEKYQDAMAICHWYGKTFSSPSQPTQIAFN